MPAAFARSPAAASVGEKSRPRQCIEPLERRCLLASVTATVETTPVPHSGDSADDVAVWVHPTDPSQSVILGSDKSGSLGGLAIYDLAGQQLAFHTIGMINGVDLRYDFPLGGAKVDLVVATNRSGSGSLMIYKLNPQTRLLEDVRARPLPTSMASNVYGATMYRSPTSGKYYAFVTSRFGGDVEQWELFDNGAGLVDAAVVRTFNVGSTSESMAVDDQTRSLYVGEEAIGIWKYGAEPTAGTARTQVDSTGLGGHLTPDIEGLAIYRAAGGQGYILASSQGSDDFTIYNRAGNHEYVDRFNIVAGATIDGVTHSDGIDVASVNLGPAFGQGIFIAHDDQNPGGNQNFKFVPWTSLATAMSLNTDTSVDPRWVVGDFSDNGYLDAPDIDLIAAQLRAGGAPPPNIFDLNADATVDADDMAYLVQTLLFTHFGDSDLDGDVDLNDLGNLATNYGGANAGWAKGDFDGDGDVDLNDLGALATHYGAGAAQAFSDFQSLTSIPDPASAALAAIGAAYFITQRRAPRRRRPATSAASHHTQAAGSGTDTSA